MTEHIQWVLRQDDPRCGHPIAVPTPIRPGTEAGPLAMPKDELSAAFLCPECGLLKLYSRSDADRRISASPSRYYIGEYDLAYIEAECADKSCGVLTKIHVALHVAKGTVCKKEQSEWRVAPQVLCAKGHPVQIDPVRNYPLRRCYMPF